MLWLRGCLGASRWQREHDRHIASLAERNYVIALFRSHRLVAAGGFVLFHDYNDPRHGADPEHGVYQAVADAMPAGRFEFCGVYGCSCLYRVK